MSQKVRIDGVKHVGASVFLGVDHCGNPCWTRNPERVMVWLCDGWRTRFNQRREQRPHNVPVKDEAGRIVDWVKEPLGGSNVAELLSDKEARLRCSWMAGIPAPILSSTDRIENTEWSAGLKRKKTIGGRVPGFKSRHRGLGFVCWRNASKTGNALFHRTGRKSGVVVIAGMNPPGWRKPGEKLHWRVIIHVRVSQPIRPYTSVHVDWIHKSLTFINMPLPLPRIGDGVIGIDRGCVHTLALSDWDLHGHAEAVEGRVEAVEIPPAPDGPAGPHQRGQGRQNRQIRLQAAEEDLVRVQRLAGSHRPA